MSGDLHAPPAPVPNFFDEGSPYLTHPLLTEERTAVEVDALAELVDLTFSRTVVDIGCGFGRHTLELTERGHRVVGVDPSPTMIAAALRAQSAATFVCGTAAELDDEFDVAICLFTTFGQITATGSTESLPADARAVLRSGGWLVLEVPIRSDVVAGLVERERLGDTDVRRRFDATTGIVHERFLLADDSCYDLTYRVFEPEEMIDQLTAAGFIDIERVARLHPSSPLATYRARNP